MILTVFDVPCSYCRAEIGYPCHNGWAERKMLTGEFHNVRREECLHQQDIINAQSAPPATPIDATADAVLDQLEQAAKADTEERF